MSPVVVRPILPCPTCAATIQEQVTVRNVTGVAQTVTLRGTYGGAALNFGGAHDPARRARGWRRPRSRSLLRTCGRRRPVPLPGRSDPLRRPGTHAARATSPTAGSAASPSGPAGQLLLNGRVLNLRGVNLHELNITTGAALSPTQLRRLVGWARELGARIIRAHYPLNPQIEQLADRDGILLWSEIPVYQVNSSC